MRPLLDITYWVLIILILSYTSSCDFIESPDTVNDPNRATRVHPDLLFTSIQVNNYLIQTGYAAWLIVYWMQQLSSNSWSFYGETYISPSSIDQTWARVYQGGGLIDIHNLIETCTERNWMAYRGIAKIYEALLMSTASSLWGDIPYSEAVSDIDFPEYDDMRDVYEALHLLLNDAINDLESGTVGYLPHNDFSLDANIGAWIEVAHSLKARLYMHWAERYHGNYDLALAEALQGISSGSSDWTCRFGHSEAEANPYYQVGQDCWYFNWMGKCIVDMLISRNDPRLPVYAAPDGDGGYSGAAQGDYHSDTSRLGDYFHAMDPDIDILTYEETQCIIAECHYYSGHETEAIAAVNNALAAQEDKWSLRAPEYWPGGEIPLLPTDGSLTGPALFTRIMEEKYICLFLNIEIWNDWKRTDLPNL